MYFTIDTKTLGFRVGSAESVGDPPTPAVAIAGGGARDSIISGLFAFIGKQVTS